MSKLSVIFFSVTPTCPNDLVESPWLKALGFTYMKQEPNWMTDGQIIDGKTIRHKIPVGGAVEFYCNDTVKRPKKDVWDDDNEDGIIRATCYHGETLSMTMNPAGMSLWKEFMYNILILG